MRSFFFSFWDFLFIHLICKSLTNSFPRFLLFIFDVLTSPSKDAVPVTTNPLSKRQMNFRNANSDIEKWKTGSNSEQLKFSRLEQSTFFNENAKEGRFQWIIIFYSSISSLYSYKRFIDRDPYFLHFNEEHCQLIYN